MSDSNPNPKPLTPNPSPIGVIVAMQAELRHLLEHVTVEREIQVGPWLDIVANANGIPLVLSRCNMGLINSAAGTQRFIDAYQPRAVINFGCTGGHRRDILPGDVVIGTRTVHHSRLHVLTTGDELYEPRRAEVGGEPWTHTEFDADPDLLATARAAAVGWTPEQWPADIWPSAVPYRQPVVHVGPVASADIWTQYIPRLDVLHARHGTLCEDMEAAAIAQICALHAVPYLTIKDISNNEYHAASDLAGGLTDFPTAEVGKRSAALTLRILERLG